MSEEQRKEGVVYLYTFPKAITKQAPSISPFAIKTMTWLRLNKVNHEVVETMDKNASPTKQIPYMYYNGTMMADSSFIIDFLTKELGFDPSEGLSDRDRAIARAVTKMVEDDLAYTIFTYRYVLHMDQYSRVLQISPDKQADAAIKATMSKNIGESMHTIGMGRKTEEDIAAIGRADVIALSHILGHQDFFMGDKPTQVDCSVFGMLSQLYVDVPYPHKAVLEGEASNLNDFMERMKQRAWPDWKEVVDEGVFE